MSGERERGSVTLFVLGLTIALMMVGGISLDLWRLLGDQRELTGLADAAAVAATSAIDVESFRLTGEVVLDPVGVDARISELLGAQPQSTRGGIGPPQVSFTLPGCDVAVRLERRFAFTILGLGTAEDLTLSAIGCAVLVGG